jgi:hypothetical protein
MPAVNFERMPRAATTIGAKPNQAVQWSTPGRWKNQTLAPNQDAIYHTDLYDTTEWRTSTNAPGHQVTDLAPCRVHDVRTGSAISRLDQNGISDRSLALAGRSEDAPLEI